MKIGDIETENKILRRLLWLRHGCPFPALYGDDGEMQCNVCMIDFKEITAEMLEKKFRSLGMKKYMKEMGGEQR